jgi:hypothetical protein
MGFSVTYFTRHHVLAYKGLPKAYVRHGYRGLRDELEFGNYNQTSKLKFALLFPVYFIQRQDVLTERRRRCR